MFVITGSGFPQVYSVSRHRDIGGYGLRFESNFLNRIVT